MTIDSAVKKKRVPASYSVSKYAKREINQDSRLLDLPPELRNTIYTYVLATDDVIQIPASGKPIRPPILKVCQQITDDATLLYYSCNKFSISAGKRLKILRRWILSLEVKERKCLGTVTVMREVSEKTAVMVARFATEIMQTDDREKQAEMLDSVRQRETEDVHASHQTFKALSVLGLNPERVQFDPPPGPDPHALIAQAYGFHGEELNENLSRCVKRLLNDRWVEFMRRNEGDLPSGDHDSSVRLSCEDVAELRSEGYTDREIFGLFTRVRREGVE
ncbi:hypothetical protein KC318_g15016 [Hortaea werneckii]|nr:hypothetical protein KC334_g15673 [Hortaea werneckii]KAI7014161.1 hypothetical protein KC355_g4795 [Hortaea werneckii]KAI7652379.1 hypothetical protein KC318_g15016 [Hortaea werneckii]RMY06826.1 hypothetical protein D0867_09560 [Hortaea werneckii]